MHNNGRRWRNVSRERRLPFFCGLILEKLLSFHKKLQMTRETRHGLLFGVCWKRDALPPPAEGACRRRRLPKTLACRKRLPAEGACRSGACPAARLRRAFPASPRTHRIGTKEREKDALSFTCGERSEMASGRCTLTPKISRPLKKPA